MSDPVVTGDYQPSTAGDVRAGEHRQVGPYRLMQVLGEGGMGTVWLAEQTHPISRKVALKLIKPGMDSKLVLARFEAERQALALMDHPNIAKVLEAGVTDTTGHPHPYFVMELVKGIPITRYCDQEKLPPRARLELFVPVCHALQHAHQKGIIHRDLKPSNILVGMYDGNPVPKVIDFGVAKVTGPRISNQTMITEVGTILGTLEYMAPEQAELNNLDVDTRSDIYSLGVILYELLVGSPPFSRKLLEDAAFDEMLRMIREVEPSKPSTKLSISDQLPSLAAVRSEEPRRLTNLLRGDLDWIVMKCLEKERTRRYETANGLAMDIQRYLSDEPVLAGPPSAGYRLRKFVRRNQGAVLAASLLLLALLIGLAGTAWGWRQAIAERNEKESARQAEAEQRMVAEKRLAQIEKSNSILGSIFSDLNPRMADKNAEPLQAVLGRRLVEAVSQLQGESIGDARVVANMQKIIGNSLVSLGHYRAALPVLKSALDTFESEFGPDNVETINCRHALGIAHQAAGHFEVALPLLEQSLAGREKVHGSNHASTLSSRNALARAYREAGQLDRALAMLEGTLKIHEETLGPGHIDTLSTRNNLAMSYRDAGKIELAVPLFEQTLAMREARLGVHHPDTLASRSNLAVAYVDIGRLDKALPLQEQTLQGYEATLGANHPHTLTIRNNLAMTYQQNGQLDKALPLFESTLRDCESLQGADHPDTLISRHNLARAYLLARQLDKALPLFEQTLQARETKLGLDHPHTMLSRNYLAVAYREAGQLDKAIPIFEQTLQARISKLGDDHVETLASRNNIGVAYIAAKRFADAEKMLRTTLTARERIHPDSWMVFYTKSLLGDALHHQRKFADAEPMLLNGYDGMKLRSGKIQPIDRAKLLPDAAERIIKLYEAWNKSDEATKWRAELEAAKTNTMRKN